MNYVKITENDIANGIGVRVVLWVAGCSHACRGCHNPHTWDANAGQIFDISALQQILSALDNPYKSGLTFSGGDPLYESNRSVITTIARIVKQVYPEKNIWLYTGYSWEEIRDLPVMKYIDVIVDGEFIQAKKDISLPFCGSTNQRVIDVQKSLIENQVVLLEV